MSHTQRIKIKSSHQRIIHRYAGGMAYTTGFQHLVGEDQADRLASIIDMAQSDPSVSMLSFQKWTLYVNSNQSGSLHCTNTADEDVYMSWMARVDASLDGLHLCFTDNTVMLPSEY